MDVLRTPEERFAGLPDFALSPSYADIPDGDGGTLRIAWVEDGPAAGPRAMPLLVPTRPDDPASEANRAAWDVLRTLDVPVLCSFSDSDPITGPMRAVLARELPGAAARVHPTIAGAGHFLQEDAGPELAAAIVEFAR